MGEALLSAEPRCLRVALEHEAIAVMHEPIEHGVGDGAIAEVGVPLTQRQLAGDVTPHYRHRLHLPDCLNCWGHFYRNLYVETFILPTLST